MDSTAELIAKTAALGEYFALPAPDAGEWRELPGLFDADVLTEFGARTRHAIAVSADCGTANIPPRLAASSLQLGIAARLLSPVIGATTCFQVVPLLNSSSVRWQWTDKHVPHFAFSEVEWCAAPTPTVAAELINGSVLTIMTPLNNVFHTALSLSPQVTWGNVTSAANGAVTVLAMTQPQHQRAGRELIRALMTTESLTDTGSFEHGTFTRRSCCLFYQAPRSGLCGDCVLTA
jgi:hypothetical protein